MYHKNMEVWKEAKNLALQIYRITENFPDKEIYGLTSQLRRCAVSIPSNIAEGCGRNTDKDTLNFISIALGSVSELETQVIISEELGYTDNTNNIYEQIKKVNALLIGLKKRLINDIRN